MRIESSAIYDSNAIPIVMLLCVCAIYFYYIYIYILYSYINNNNNNNDNVYSGRGTDDIGEKRDLSEVFSHTVLLYY